MIVDEIGNLSAEPGSRAWAVALRREIHYSLRSTQVESDHLHALLRLMEQHHGHRVLEDHRGKPFPSHEALCGEKYPWGLGDRLMALIRVLASHAGVEIVEPDAPEHGNLRREVDARRFRVLLLK